MEASEQSSNPQLPLFLILGQLLLHVLAQFTLLITLILQLTDLGLIKGLAGGQLEIQLISYYRSGLGVVKYISSLLISSPHIVDLFRFITNLTVLC